MKRVAPIVGLATLAIAALMVGAAQPALAARLVGVVLSREDNRPIPLATVRVLDTLLHAETSENGTFLLSRLPPGRLRIGIALVGYRPLLDSLVVADSDTLIQRQYFLEPIAFAMREVVIQPKPGSVRSEGQVITTEEMKRLPATADDVFRAVQLSPGIAAPDLAASFLVRGGESDETLVRLDDVDLLEPYHIRDWGGAVSIVNLGTVETASMVRGGLPARYGRHLSGALEIETPRLRTDQPTTTLGINFTQARAILAGPVGSSGSYLVGAREGFVAALYRAYQFDPDTDLEPDFQDVMAEYRAGIGKRHELTLLGVATRDHLRYSEPFDENDIDGDQHDLTLGARWRGKLSDRVQTALVVSGDVFDRDRTLGHTGRDMNLTRAVRGRLEADLTLWPDHVLQAGLLGEWEDARVQFQSIDAFIDDGVYVERQMSLVSGTAIRRRFESYLSLASRFGTRVSSTVGVNMAVDDYDWGLLRDGSAPPSEPGRGHLSPRLAAAWRVASWLTCRAALSLLRQPTFLNYLDADRTAITLGRPRDTREGIAGIEVRHRGFEARIDAYHRDDRGVSFPVQDLARKPSASLDEGTAWGLEVLVRSPSWRRFDVWASYVRSRAVWSTPDGDVPRSFDQPHAATLSMNHRWLGALNLNATARYHTGNAYTEVRPVGGPYTWTSAFGPFMGARYPDYFRLDFRASYPLHLGRGGVVYVDLVNATDRENVYYYWWAFDELPNGAISPRRGFMELFPRFPYLGFEVTF